jgi:UDP-glucose 4-epimerase
MILIVGSQGFLGSALVKFFKKKIIKLDKEYSKNSNNVNIAKIIKLENIFKKKKIKYVINVAAEPASSKCKKKICETNVIGNKNLIFLSEKYKIRKYIFISTSALFVKNYIKPVTENNKPNPIESYGFSKLKAEYDIINSNLNNYVIFRCPMIVSKNRLGVLSFLFDLIKNDKVIPVLGSGRNLLQFVGINDLIKVIHKSLTKIEKEVYNVASNEKITFVSLISKLIKLVNSRSKIINFPDIGFSIILNVLNKINLSPFNIYHLKMIKYTFTMNINKLKNNYRYTPKDNTSKLIEDAFINYLAKKNDKIKTEITNPIKLGILKILYKIC